MVGWVFGWVGGRVGWWVKVKIVSCAINGTAQKGGPPQIRQKFNQFRFGSNIQGQAKGLGEGAHLYIYILIQTIFAFVPVFLRKLTLYGIIKKDKKVYKSKPFFFHYI